MSLAHFSSAGATNVFWQSNSEGETQKGPSSSIDRTGGKLPFLGAVGIVEAVASLAVQ